ncbi:aldehyde dehydrogenase family protein [Alteromonas gilva]|uniref:Aldehyde dehydrogenase family protein n=1 Tax=Alteromonas gilva TaxID=2987522 RepID=A0ABT5KZR5_9ALTE|nr:aldehyde dehydrogenase family protein [Alteromonas gilva]MDC8830265.1 aldehyde dehydrogenase family protein [Alteromonas gilva]
MQRYKTIIDGRQCHTDKHIDVLNPATAMPFAQMALSSVEQVDEAVQAAAVAFESWRQTSADERKEYLHQLAALLEQNMPELMALITQETGKPLNGLHGVGAGMEVGGAAAWIHVNADYDLPVEVLQDNDTARIELHRKPLGVVASVTPWNWPLLIASWHITPALRAGNTVVIKPSPLTPVTTARFVELANTVLPPGVLNLVAGGAEVGARLTSHPKVAKVIFTGSTPTGKRIMQGAAEHLQRLTLELGGNDAGIVLSDVDVKAVAPKLVAAALNNNGQTCAALKRLYVHDSIYEALGQEIANVVSKITLGNGLEDGVELGPLQNKTQLNIVSTLVEKARQNGARILCGGEPFGNSGFFYSPTVLLDVDDQDAVVSEEQFGPVIPLIRYTDIDDAVARANALDVGLGSSVWSQDVNQATEIAHRLEAGTTWINDHGTIQPDMPFGGVKQSGMGVEFGLHGLHELTRLHAVKIAR